MNSKKVMHVNTWHTWYVVYVLYETAVRPSNLVRNK